MATKKKAAAKKASAKKAPAKKASAKKASPKKASPKKASAKKASPKKAPAKKAAPTGDTLKARARTRAAEPAPAKPAAAPKKPVLRDPELDLAQALAALALDKKAEGVVILRVTDLTSYADAFVLASAPSERQVQAIARHVDDEMRKAGKAPVGSEGLEQGHWVLVDFGAVVLHVFLASARQYYDLEGFWSDAPRVDADEEYGKSIVASMLAAREEARAQA
jgi:ribosome-associated protein